MLIFAGPILKWTDTSKRQETYVRVQRTMPSISSLCRNSSKLNMHTDTHAHTHRASNEITFSAFPSHDSAEKEADEKEKLDDDIIFSHIF